MGISTTLRRPECLRTPGSLPRHRPHGGAGPLSPAADRVLPQTLRRCETYGARRRTHDVQAPQVAQVRKIGRAAVSQQAAGGAIGPSIGRACLQRGEGGGVRPSARSSAKPPVDDSRDLPRSGRGGGARVLRASVGPSEGVIPEWGPMHGRRGGDNIRRAPEESSRGRGEPGRAPPQLRPREPAPRSVRPPRFGAEAVVARDGRS